MEGGVLGIIGLFENEEVEDDCFRDFNKTIECLSVLLIFDRGEEEEEE